MIVLSIGAVSAQDADDAAAVASTDDDAIASTDGDTIASTNDDTVLEDSEATASGSVSGGVDVVTENPWSNTGEISYDIPADAKTIKSADVYVNVFSVKNDDSYGVIANTTITTDNGQVVYNESLCYNAVDKTQVYQVTDNATKSNLDFMIHYDITNQLTGLNGTTLKIKVDTSGMEGKQTSTNVGYIKLIGLVLTYDDGDDDIIKYWINDNQEWTSSNTTLTFDTTSMGDVLEMSLTNIALDSGDATYLLNGEFLTDPEYKSGSYYRYNRWDVTEYYNSSKKTEFLGIGAQGSYGVSHKQALAVLVAKPGVASASLSLATERSGKVYSDTAVPIVYPGLSNKVTITVTTNKNGKYIVKLLADGIEVNSTEIYLTAGTKPVPLMDNTPRAINASSTYTGRDGTYNSVNYTAQLFLKEESLTNASIDAVILYNGYFNKALYDQNSLEPFYNVTITGDIVIDVLDFPVETASGNTSGKYASGTANRVDNWTVTLKDGSVIVKAFIYVPYTSITGDNIAMLNATFNNKALTPVAFIRDQSNAVGVGGYGVLVYDVTDYIINGNNTLELNRTLSGGIYPSTLIYLTNTTGSEVIKNVYITNCADLLGAYGNGDRQLKIDSTFNLVSNELNNAKVYIFAAGTEPGRASVLINGVRDDNAFNTTTKSSVSYYEKDITDIMRDTNEISLILNKGMFTALQQIFVTTKSVPAPVVPVATKITAPSVTTIYNTNKNFVVTLKDANGNAVANAKVTVVLNGAKKVLTTNSKGQATLAIPANLVPKTYAVSITYDGDATHVKSSASSKVIVKKATVKLTAKKKTFKAKVKVKKYTVILKDNKGKVMKKVKLFLKVKGKTYKATTNAKGKAIFKINKLTKKGKYTAKVTYKATKFFNAKTVKVKITVKK